MLRANALALAAAVLMSSAFAAPEHRCPDLWVRAPELERMLDQTLGSLGALVDQRSVTIHPDERACYLRFSLTTSALEQFGACHLDGCSTVMHRQKSLALREFEVHGCDPLFNAFGFSRRVPTHYIDASRNIRALCGSDDFEIDRVVPVWAAGEPKLRVSFRRTPQ